MRVRRCVTKELRALGKDYAGSAAAARQFMLHKCPHCGGGGEAAGGQGKGGKRGAEGEGAEEDEEEQEEGGEEGAGGGKKGSGKQPVPAAECIRACIGERV